MPPLYVRAACRRQTLRERNDRNEFCLFTPTYLVARAIAVPIQMRYNIILRGVGARQCRAPTGVPHVNENRYSNKLDFTNIL
ncbi:hypothetical protein [Nostoc sp.]|uniref:hypothetical protein n=1 Tax=Nostoc sp. TaxID=1180 RepID=UPI002FF57B81